MNNRRGDSNKQDIPLPLHDDEELARRLNIAFNKGDADSVDQIKSVLANRGVYFTADCYV